MLSTLFRGAINFAPTRKGAWFTPDGMKIRSGELTELAIREFQKNLKPNQVFAFIFEDKLPRGLFTNSYYIGRNCFLLVGQEVIIIDDNLVPPAARFSHRLGNILCMVVSRGEGRLLVARAVGKVRS